MVAFIRSARVEGDPDRYVRPARNGSYQARPYDEGVRYNLGLFPTRVQARKAILEFWWGRFRPRLRFTREVRTRAGSYWAAVVRVPSYLTRREPDGTRTRGGVHRVPGRYATADAAHTAAHAWLVANCGPLMAWWILSGSR